MTKHTVVIGTGFLGAVVVENLRRSGVRPLHTYRHHRIFSDSVRFDVFRQRLSDVVPISEIGTVIFTARIEDAIDSAELQSAMRTLFCECRDIRNVYVSSDAVFDGRLGMYAESDVANPMTRYGRNKVACEDILRALAPNHCIIRPSYIFGFSCGQLDPRLTEARTSIRNGVPFHRFVDMYKSPIEVNRLASIVVKAARSSFRGILHAGTDRVSVYDFFRKSLVELGEDTRLLLPARLPDSRPAEFLVDTSLNSTLLGRVLGETPQLLEGLSVSTGSKWQDPRTPNGWSCDL